MKLTEARGKLVVIGGAEEYEGDAVIHKEFLKLAGGDESHIVVITTATENPDAAREKWTAAFKKLGAKKVEAIDVSSRMDSQKPESLKAIERATGLYFTGGDQLFITSLMGGSELQKLIYQRYEEGLVIAGSSAGAAMMANSMILRGDAEMNPRVGSVEIGPGMDLIVGSVIDTHFSQRGRHGRLLAAVAHYPQELGIGIDENTAMIVDKGKFRVLGEGSVTIIDGNSMTYTNMPYIKKDRSLTLADVKIHVLGENAVFDLQNRCLIIDASNKAAKAASRSEENKENKK